MILYQGIDGEPCIGLTQVVLNDSWFLCQAFYNRKETKQKQEASNHGFAVAINSISMLTSICSAIFCMTILGIIMPWSATGTKKSVCTRADSFLIVKVPRIILSLTTPWIVRLPFAL